MLALGNEGTRSESHYKRITRFINSWHKDEKLYDTQVDRTGRSPVIFIARHTPPPPEACCRRYFFTQNPGFQITCTFSVHRAGNQILYIFGQGFHPKSINTTSCSMRSKIKYTFTASVWQHSAPGGWYFVSLPQATALEIRQQLQWQEHCAAQVPPGSPHQSLQVEHSP